MQIVPVGDEDGSNVDNITQLAEEAFGLNPLVLVGANGLKIEDSDSTNGNFPQKSFWRSNARKVFAVQNYTEQIDKTRSQQHLLEELKEMLHGKIINPDADGKIIKSLELVSSLKQIFKCMICHATINPPALISTCCMQISGCKLCIESCDKPKCPHCRNEEVYGTIKLGNLTDVINDIKTL